MKKRRKLEIVDGSHVKYDIIKQFAAFCVLFAFFHLKKAKKFYPKMAWPPATYDVIFRNHSNRVSPNLRQNVSKGYAYRY